MRTSIALASTLIGLSGCTTPEPDLECNWDDPTVTQLGSWQEPTSDGRSAEDYFGFAMGPFERPLFWDDGAETTVTFLASPKRAEVLDYAIGDEPLCGSSLIATGMFSFVTGDGRLDTTFPFQWQVEDLHGTLDLGHVRVGYSVPPQDLSIPRLDDSSHYWLTVLFRTDGRIQGGLTEWWELDELTTRRCGRAGIDGPPGECVDDVSENGSE